MRREGNHPGATKINGARTCLTVQQNYFESDATDGYQVDRISKFADGNSWNMWTPVKQTGTGRTDGGPILYGYLRCGTTSWQGLAGDERISTVMVEDDHLSGGGGTDRLYGGDV